LQGTDERGTIKTEAEERKFSAGAPEIPESIIGQLPEKAFEELYWKAQREELEGEEFQKELALLQWKYGGENAEGNMAPDGDKAADESEMPPEQDAFVSENGTKKLKYPGDDPYASPGEDWEWRGPRDKGSWYNQNTRESMRSDLNHADPIGLHWDYKDENGIWYRLKPDGTLVPKKQ
jgi:hypothetical protein